MFILVIPVLIFAFILGCAINALFVLLGAKLCGVESRNYRTAFWASVVAGLITIVVYFAVIRVIDNRFIIGVVGLHISAFVFMHYFDTTFGRALGTALAAWVGYEAMAMLVVMVISIATGLV